MKRDGGPDPRMAIHWIESECLSDHLQLSNNWGFTWNFHEQLELAASPCWRLCTVPDLTSKSSPPQKDEITDYYWDPSISNFREKMGICPKTLKSPSFRGGWDNPNLFILHYLLFWALHFLFSNGSFAKNWIKGGLMTSLTDDISPPPPCQDKIPFFFRKFEMGGSPEFTTTGHSFTSCGDVDCICYIL